MTGIRFGFLIGLFFTIPMSYNWYVILPIPYHLALRWFLFGMGGNHYRRNHRGATLQAAGNHGRVEHQKGRSALQGGDINVADAHESVHPFFWELYTLLEIIVSLLWYT